MVSVARKWIFSPALPRGFAHLQEKNSRCCYRVTPWQMRWRAKLPAGESEGRLRQCTHAPRRKQGSLLDHLVGAGEQRRRHLQAERLGGLQIDHQLVLGRRLHWQVGRLLALEDAIHVASRQPVLISKIDA